MITPQPSTEHDHQARGLVVGAALLNRLGNATQVLVAQRAYPESLKGLWEFPGGKVQPHEEPKEALEREIQEELGLSIRLGQEVSPPIGHQAWPLDNGLDMRVWTAVAVDHHGRILPLNQLPAGARSQSPDHLELRWLDLNQNTEVAVDWITADRPIVRALVETQGRMPTFC